MLDLAPLPSSRPKFLVDGMLGSLVVKLRILGYDTLYGKDKSDEDLIQESLMEVRILLTSDKELFLRAKKRSANSLLISAKSEEGRIVELCKKVGIKRLETVRMPLCSVCNSKLYDTSEKDDLGRLIFKCSLCGKLYWVGSHWKNLNCLFRSVNRELRREDSSYSKAKK